jgi:hypothetical protein
MKSVSKMNGSLNPRDGIEIACQKKTISQNIKTMTD